MLKKGPDPYQEPDFGFVYFIVGVVSREFPPSVVWVALWSVRMDYGLRGTRLEKFLPRLGVLNMVDLKCLILEIWISNGYWDSGFKFEIWGGEDFGNFWHIFNFIFIFLIFEIL